MSAMRAIHEFMTCRGQIHFFYNGLCKKLVFKRFRTEMSLMLKTQRELSEQEVLELLVNILEKMVDESESIIIFEEVAVESEPVVEQVVVPKPVVVPEPVVVSEPVVVPEPVVEQVVVPEPVVEKVVVPEPIVVEAVVEEVVVPEPVVVEAVVEEDVVPEPVVVEAVVEEGVIEPVDEDIQMCEYIEKKSFDSDRSDEFTEPPRKIIRLSTISVTQDNCVKATVQFRVVLETGSVE